MTPRGDEDPRHRPLRGPGLEQLRTLGEVIEEPWITGPTSAMTPARTPTSWPRASRELGADVVICRGRQREGPGARAAAARDRLDPRRPHQRRPRRGDRRGHPGAPGAGPQRRRRRRAGRGAAAGVHPRASSPPTPTCATGRGVPRRHDPLPAVPGVAARRAHRRPRRSTAPSAAPRRGGSPASACGSSPTTRSPPTRTHSTSTPCSP